MQGESLYLLRTFKFRTLPSGTIVPKKRIDKDNLFLLLVVRQLLLT